MAHDHEHDDDHDHRHGEGPGGRPHRHHGHAHSHVHAGEAGLGLAVVVNVLLTVAQVLGGILSGSVALIADAVHNLSDAAALVIAVGPAAGGARAPAASTVRGRARRCRARGWVAATSD